MAKRSGLGGALYLNGLDLSGDVGSIDQAAASRTLLSVPGIDKSANELIAGLATGALDFTGYFNDATDQLHLTARALGAAAAIQNITYAVATTIGDPAFMLRARQVDYAPSRSADGALTIPVTAVGVDGVIPEWGKMLTTGLVTQGSAAALASLDNAASSASGLAAMLHVASITGGGSTLTVTIQESSDDGSGDAWTTKLAMAGVAQASAATSERATATGTVERYTRIITTGGWTQAKFALAMRRGTADDIDAY